MRINPSFNRRNVFVDIETVALDADDEKALAQPRPAASSVSVG